MSEQFRPPPDPPEDPELYVELEEDDPDLKEQQRRYREMKDGWVLDRKTGFFYKWKRRWWGGKR